MEGSADHGPFGWADPQRPFDRARPSATLLAFRYHKGSDHDDCGLIDAPSRISQQRMACFRPHRMTRQGSRVSARPRIAFPGSEIYQVGRNSFGLSAVIQAENL